MNFKVSQLKSLTAGEVAVDDLIYVIDSNPTDGSVKSKKVTVGDLIDSRIYGISSSQFVLITGYYADPSWITSLDWSKITNAPSFVTSLSALTDVQLSTPLSGQALVYNGSKWVNQGIGELDTLATVTTRGNTTTNSISVGGLNVDSGVFYVDPTNNRIGINTTTPGFSIENLIPNVSGGSNVGLFISDFNLSFSGSSSWLAWGRRNDFLTMSSGIRALYLGNNGFEQGLAFHTASGGSGALTNASATEAMRITNTRNILIGTTTDSGFKLDVNGSSRVSGVTTVATGSQRISFNLSQAVYIGLGVNNNQIGANNSNCLFIGSQGDLPIYSLAGGTVIICDLANPASSASAKLRIDSTIQGFLQPRMTNTQAVAITTPATGLQLYDTTNNKNLLYNGTLWQNIATETWVAAQGYLTTAPTLASVTTAGNTTTTSIEIINSTSGAGPTFLAAESWTTGQYKGIALSHYNTGTTTNQWISANTDAVVSGVQSNSLSIVHNGSGYISFWTGVVASEKLRIFNNGNIKLGATNDVGFKFDVVGTGRFTQNLYLDSALIINSYTDAGYKLDVNGTGIFRGNLEVNAGGNGGIFVNNVYPRLIFGKTGTPSWSMNADTENSGQFEIGSGAGFPYNNFSRYIYLGIIGQRGIGLFGIPNGNTKFLVSGSTNAQSNLAQGVSMSNTLVATANNDVLVGLDINPTFTNGAFTGVSNWALRMFNSVRFQTDSDLGQGIYWKPANDGTTLRVYGSTYSAGIGYLQLNVQSGADGLVVNGGARTLSINAAQTSIALNLNNITFNTHGTGEAMRIVNTTKNVLIGTTTDAGYKLDVNGSARTLGTHRIWRDNAVAEIKLELFGGQTGWESSIYHNIGSGGSDQRLTFRVGGNTSASDRMTISGSNVGVGTTSPTGRNGYGGGTLVELVDNIAYSSFNLNGGNISSPTYFTLGAQGAGADIRVNNKPLRIAVNSVDVLTIPTTGNVLINTTTDSGYKLDVNGITRVTTGTAGTGIHLTSTVSGNTGTLVISPNSTAIGSFGDFTIATPNGTRLFIGGNYQTLITSTVGLNVSSALQVGGNLLVSGGGLSQIYSTDFVLGGTGNTSANIYFTSSGYNESKILWRVENQGTYGVSNLHLCINGNTTTTRATIADARVSFLSNGNVGIGTTTDLARLTVKGSGSTSATKSLLVQNSAGTVATEIYDDRTLRQWGQAFFHSSNTISFASDRISMQPYTGFGIRYRGVNVFELYATETNDMIGMQIDRGLSIYDAGAPVLLDNSAKLQINSTNRGFLAPRMTTAQKNAITSPATGLEVYDSTTNTPNYFNGTTWVGVASNQSTGLSPGLFSQTSDSVAVTNTTVESSLISTGVGTLSVPANGFQVGAAYIAYFSGVMSSQNNATMEIHLRSNGFVLADTNPMILSATTGKFWELHVNFVIRAIGGGGVAAIVTSGRFSYNKDSGNTPESLGFSGVNNTTFDTTINNTLAVTATWGNASPSNSIQTRIFNLYRVY
jgi:hypothetical protein